MARKTEKERVLDDLIRTAEAIARTFGSSCETLIHDMKKPGHPVVAIFNNHVSGRQVGSTADIFGGDLGEREIDFDHFNMEDAVNTLAITNAGRYIKSTSVRFEGKDYHYVLGINYDYTPLIGAVPVLQDLTSTSADLGEHLEKQKGKSQLEELFEDCVRLIGKPVEQMKKPDKVRLVALLRERNAFDFQKSVIYIADRLDVSRYTVYKYIHEVEEGM